METINYLTKRLGEILGSVIKNPVRLFLIDKAKTPIGRILKILIWIGLITGWVLLWAAIIPLPAKLPILAAILMSFVAGIVLTLISIPLGLGLEWIVFGNIRHHESPWGAWERIFERE